MLACPIYSQRDPKWASIPIGNKTIGSNGCFGTSIAMGLANFSITVTPDQFFSKMKAIGAIEPDSSTDICEIHKAFPDVYYLCRVDTSVEPPGKFSRQDISEALNRIRNFVREGMIVLLNVDASPFNGIADGDHWVLCVESDLTIHDPWYGDRTNFSQRYGNPTKGVYGYCVLVGNPIAYGDPSESSRGDALAKLMAFKNDPKKYANYLNEAIDHLCCP